MVDSETLSSCLEGFLLSSCTGSLNKDSKSQQVKRCCVESWSGIRYSLIMSYLVPEQNSALQYAVWKLTLRVLSVRLPHCLSAATWTFDSSRLHPLKTASICIDAEHSVSWLVGLEKVWQVAPPWATIAGSSSKGAAKCLVFWRYFQALKHWSTIDSIPVNLNLKTTFK